MDGIFQCSLCDTDRNRTDDRTGCLKRLHSDAEAHAFTTDAGACRNEAIIKNDFRSSRSTDPHLVLFLADGDARRISIDSENGEATNAA